MFSIMLIEEVAFNPQQEFFCRDVSYVLVWTYELFIRHPTQAIKRNSAVQKVPALLPEPKFVVLNYTRALNLRRGASPV